LRGWALSNLMARVMLLARKFTKGGTDVRIPSAPGKLCVLAVFVLLTTGTARAGVLSLWDGTGRMTRQVGQRWALTKQLSHRVLRQHRRMASRCPAVLQ